MAHTLDIEQRKKNETYYKERRSTRGTTTRTTRGLRPYTTPRRQTESETKTPERIPERNPRYEGTRGYGQNNRGLGRPKPWAKAKIQDKKQDHTSHQHSKERQKWNGGPSKPRDGQKNNNCYNCGKADHFSNDCQLPKRERTFVRAARSVKTNGSDGEADDESREAGGYDSDKLSTISENNEDRNESDPDEWIEVEVPMENEYYEEDDNDDRMFAIRTYTGETLDTKEEGEVNQDFTMATVVFPLKGNEKTSDIKMRKHKLIPSRKTRMRPRHSEEDKRCLATWVGINGLQAWTLWDSGSTTTGITPAFAELAQIPVDELEDPHILQLGTIGSRSAIKYGADVEVNIEGEKQSTYVDIANFDRYEMIIGTPFMRRNKVILDLEKDEVIFKGRRIPGIKVSTKEAELFARRQRSTDKQKE